MRTFEAVLNELCAWVLAGFVMFQLFRMLPW